MTTDIPDLLGQRQIRRLDKRTRSPDTSNLNAVHRRAQELIVPDDAQIGDR